MKESQGPLLDTPSLATKLLITSLPSHQVTYCWLMTISANASEYLLWTQLSS